LNQLQAWGLYCTVGYSSFTNFCILAVFTRKFRNFIKSYHAQKWTNFLIISCVEIVEKSTLSSKQICTCKVQSHTTFWVFFCTLSIMEYLVVPPLAKTTSCIRLGMIKMNLSSCCRDTHHSIFLHFLLDLHPIAKNLWLSSKGSLWNVR